MDELDKWLDAYELELLLRDVKESPHPIELLKSWYNQAFHGTADGSWYEWDDDSGGC
jgi:hypothetical protein